MTKRASRAACAVPDQIERPEDLLPVLKAADELIRNLFMSALWGKTRGLDCAALNTVPPLIERTIEALEARASAFQVQQVVE